MTVLISLLFVCLLVAGTLSGCQSVGDDESIGVSQLTQTAAVGLDKGVVRVAIGIRGSQFTDDSLAIVQDRGLLLQVTNKDNRSYRLRCADNLLPPSPVPARKSAEFAIYAPSTGSVRCELLANDRDLIVASLMLDVREAGGDRP